MWEYETSPARWVCVVGDWRAVVERSATQPQWWEPRIEPFHAPEARQYGPTSDDPMRGRAWCLRRIAEHQAYHRSP